MTLNDMLVSSKIDPETVLVMRHRPWESRLNEMLPWLAAEKPHIFNAYQQTQGEKTENAMMRAKYLASFIGREPGKALFVGFYAVKSFKPITKSQFWKIPANIELKSLGMNGFSDDSERDTICWFELKLTKFYAHWKGKLIVRWPGKELSWWRWADRNEIQVLAIHDASVLDDDMPPWNEIDLTWESLQVLLARWKAALEQWRGIYYIYDVSDGKGYVGAAYGKQNIYQRWIDYAARGHGGNKWLRKRDPINFRFSILQRVSPDMEISEVAYLEKTWKQRLHTWYPQGLNDN